MNDAAYEEQLAETERAYDATAQRYKGRWHTRDPLADDKRRFSDVAGVTAALADLGCGTGRDLAWFVDRGHDVVGVDRSQAMLRIAHDAVPGARLVRADIRQLPLDDRSFDGWWASAVLLHLSPDDALVALREAHRITRPGGFGFVAVRQGLGTRLEQVDDTPYRRYFCYWQAGNLDEMLGHAGWEIRATWTAPDSEGRHPWLTRIVRAG